MAARRAAHVQERDNPMTPMAEIVWMLLGICVTVLCFALLIPVIDSSSRHASERKKMGIRLRDDDLFEEGGNQ